MTNKITETLELMCDRSNPQDKKILLLAELVEHKCDALAENQRVLQRSLDVTNEKLDTLTHLLRRYEEDIHECPVYKDKGKYERFFFYMRNPKTTLLTLLGALALLGGFFGSTLTNVVRKLLDL